MHDPLHAPPRPRKSIDDQLVPLINIVFLLLIFFMVAGQITQRDALIEPPESLSRKPAPATPALLVLERDGALSIDGHSIEPRALAAALGAYRADGGVTLAADRDVLASDLAPVLIAVRGAGFETVTLYARHGEQP
mgnify:FL=1